jgi:hypothetical protein
MKTLCPVCNAEFEVVARLRDKAAHKFCSNKCRQKNFYYKFKSEKGIRYKNREKPIKRRASSLTRKGISKSKNKYIATIFNNGKIYQKAYSIKRLGEKGARLAASLQRMAWVVDFGVWNPNDGDPFAILSYSDAFKGNAEYENCVVDGENSPFIQKRDVDD